jgi:hypothetical protein
MSRPTFNVFEPHEGVTVITMNDEMRELLNFFIGEVHEVEPEVHAFSQALANPTKAREIRARKGLVADSRQISALSNAIVTSWPEEEDKMRPARNGQARTRQFQPR